MNLTALSETDLLGIGESGLLTLPETSVAVLSKGSHMLLTTEAYSGAKGAFFGGCDSLTNGVFATE